MEMHDWMERGNRVLAGTYARLPVVMTEGKGCILTDASGQKYLDFVSGIAVCSLGHCHPAITKAVQHQVARLVHVSNLYHTIPQIELAEILTSHSFGDRIFFANSGAEANEAAIKLARKFSGPGRFEIIALEGSFHGRTLATIAATGQAKFKEGFEPMPEGFVHVPFDDMAALAAAVNERTCAVLCEPIQGESGVRPMPMAYLQAVRRFCTEKGILLILDEVQVGLGRTGLLFAYEHFGITPDIMTLAKAMGNGLPIGAMVTTEKIAAAFTPGSHASTFGGNPVVCAGAVAALGIIAAEDFLQSVRQRGDYLAQGLRVLAQKYPQIIGEVRGLGLIQGAVLMDAWIDKGPAIVDRLFHRGVLINFAGGKALRFIPPLIVTNDEIDVVLTALEKVLSELVSP